MHHALRSPADNPRRTARPAAGPRRRRPALRLCRRRLETDPRRPGVEESRRRAGQEICGEVPSPGDRVCGRRERVARAVAEAVSPLCRLRRPAGRSGPRVRRQNPSAHAEAGRRPLHRRPLGHRHRLQRGRRLADRRDQPAAGDPPRRRRHGHRPGPVRRGLLVQRGLGRPVHRKAQGRQGGNQAWLRRRRQADRRFLRAVQAAVVPHLRPRHLARLADRLSAAPARAVPLQGRRAVRRRSVGQGLSPALAQSQGLSALRAIA